MNQLVITRPDGSSLRVAGYRAGAPPPEVARYGAGRLDALPARVDLRSYMTPVENQGQTSSCVANATAGAYEYLVKRHRGDDAYDVSRLFIYFNARKLAGTEHEDSGSQIQDAIGGLKQFGACSETTWPFQEEVVNSEPDENAYSEASSFIVEQTQAVPVDLDTWKHALAEGHPIIFGIMLFDSFDRQRKKGLVPLPSNNERGRDSHGAHAMLCVGYSDKDRVFIVRNSWGTDWGDQGYCYMPYDYVMNPELNLGDAWIIQQLDNFELDQDLWLSDEQSLLPTLDAELHQLTDEEHQALLDACGRVPLETRLALILMAAAGADGTLSDEEGQQLAEYMLRLMQALGSDLDPAKVLSFAAKHIDDQALLEESVAIFGEHLSEAFLARVVNEATSIASADGLDSGEEGFIDQLVQAWQVGDEEAGGGDGGEEEPADDEGLEEEEEDDELT